MCSDGMDTSLLVLTLSGQTCFDKIVCKAGPNQDVEFTNALSVADELKSILSVEH